MYALINNLINHNWATGDSAQQYIYYICGAVIIILTVVFIDLVYRLFRSVLRIN